MNDISHNASVVVLNWRRSDFLRQVSLPLLEKCQRVNEIIISHGLEATFFDYQSDQCKIVNRKDWEINSEYGLARRFLASQDASNDCVLMMDDDIVAFDKVVDKLHDFFLDDPEILHGEYGRNLNWDFSYSDRDAFGEVTFVLTGLVATSQRKCNLFLENMSSVETMVRENSMPLWNGEDIFHAALSLRESGRLNHAYKSQMAGIPAYWPPDPSTVAASEKHLAWRREFSRHLVEIFGLHDLVRRIPPPKHAHGFPTHLGRIFSLGL